MMKKERLGLCSNYLARLVPVEEKSDATESSKLKFFIRSTAFKLPGDPATPIIMIGPGLGLAPFRSFIEERARYRDGEKATETQEARNYLYFGCRYTDRDYYFRDDLQDYLDRGVISQLRVAFSREKPKCYVQDLLQADAELIRKLMRESNANLYVAGNSKLPEDIRALLGKILSSEIGDSLELAADATGSESDRLVSQLESANRIQYDCW